MIEKKKIFLAIVLFVSYIQIYGNKVSDNIQIINDSIMGHKLNFELLDKYATRKWQMKDSIGEYIYYSWKFTENGVETHLSGSTRNGFSVWQTPPAPAFFKIYKEFYSNGYLKLKGKCMGSNTRVGLWKYFDETGKLIKTVDEDAKFGKFGYNELLLFLHEQGHINIETGENRERTDFGYNTELKQWDVYTISNYWITEYAIDGETGEVIEKKESDLLI